MEEGTGTWCGWCPRGIVAFRYMAEKYPETFIGIAVHKSDNLETNTYSYLKFNGYPSCYVNRNLRNSTSPEAGTLEVMHNKAVAIPPHVGVEVTASLLITQKRLSMQKLLQHFLPTNKV